MSDYIPIPVPPVPAGRINARAMAGSFAASRGPLLSVDRVLNLRALCALARAETLSLSQIGEPGSTGRTELSRDDLAILAEGGWSQVPTVATRFDTVRIDFWSLDVQVDQVWVDVVYLMAVSGSLRGDFRCWGEPDLRRLATLWEALHHAPDRTTPRQHAWLQAG